MLHYFFFKCIAPNSVYYFFCFFREGFYKKFSLFGLSKRYLYLSRFYEKRISKNCHRNSIILCFFTKYFFIILYKPYLFTASERNNPFEKIFNHCRKHRQNIQISSLLLTGFEESKLTALVESRIASLILPGNRNSRETHSGSLIITSNKLQWQKKEAYNFPLTHFLSKQQKDLNFWASNI